jgi:GNAT superfamily N-acetyltransferase
VVLARGSGPYPGAYTNAAIRVDRRVSAVSTLALAGGFFAEAGHGYVLWAREGADDDLLDAVRTAGWTERPPADGMPAMVREQRVEERDPPPGIRIVRLGDAEAATAYLMVLARAYGLDGIAPAVASGMFFDPSAVAAPNVAAYAAYAGSTALSAVMTIVAQGVAGICWAATLPAERGRGLAEACGRRAVNAAFDLGANVVTLQSSVRGRDLWHRVGFREAGRYRRFLAVRTGGASRSAPAGRKSRPRSRVGQA